MAPTTRRFLAIAMQSIGTFAFMAGLILFTLAAYIGFRGVGVAAGDMVMMGILIGATLVAGVVLYAGGAVIARRDAGRCPQCDYDLRGQREGGCPECGWGRTFG